MNAIQKALDALKFTIPRAVLEKAFIDRRIDWRQTGRANIDDQILNNVVRARVLVDCNLIGGTQALIPLDGLGHDRPNDFYGTVIHIPKALTQGRSINSVLNVGFMSAGMAANWGVANTMGSVGAYAGQESTALMSSMQAMVASYDKIPMTSTARVQLIAENTILIRDSISFAPNGWLRCILANDENLGNIQLRSYKHFSQLVEYAVKSYIYNELIINLDQGELQGGQTIGVFKEIIQGYSDAEQNYKDYLTDVWEAVAFMNDGEAYGRYIKLILGGAAR